MLEQLKAAVSRNYDEDRRLAIESCIMKVARRDLPELDWTVDEADDLISRVFGVVNPAPPSTGLGTRYEPTPSRTVVEMVRRLDLRTADVFVDVGCGRGLLLALVASLVQCKVIGIEADPTLASEASSTLERIAAGRSQVLVDDATHGRLPPASVYFLFNPFEEEADLSKVYQLILSQPHPETVRILSLGASSPFFKAKAQHGKRLRHVWGGGDVYKTVQCFAVYRKNSATLVE